MGPYIEFTASRVAWHFKRAGIKKMGRKTITKLASSGWCGARKEERKGAIGFYYLFDGALVKQEIEKMKAKIEEIIAAKIEDKKRRADAEKASAVKPIVKGKLFDPGRKEQYETITIDPRLKRIIVDRAEKKGVSIGQECSALVGTALAMVDLVAGGAIPVTLK